MKRLIKNIGLAILLIALVLIVIPAYAQGPVPPISPEAQKEKDRLLAEYQKALDYELQYGETAINPEYGQTKMLIGNSAEKMDLLWQETQRKIEAVIARPANEREPIVKLIEAISRETPTYVRRWHFPYNSKAELEHYQTSKYLYTVDIASSQVVEIFPADPANFSYNTEQLYSQAELEEKARDFILTVVGDINLESLQPAFGNKSGQNFFFRWEDPSKKLPDNTIPFIQVGFSVGGDFLNYINTLPVAETSLTFFGEQIGVLPAKVLAAFNEAYANGGSYWEWVNGGGAGTYNTQENAGYCYTQGSWCWPKNYYYQWTNYYPIPYLRAKWKPTVTSQYVNSYAWIPNSHATVNTQYLIVFNDGSSVNSNSVNQFDYYDAWAPLAGYNYIYHNIKEIHLNNAGASNKEVAWDETWLYRP